MENYFKKLSAINVKGMAEKKGRFNYLSWANAWALIKENYPEANRNVYESEHTGLNYFTDGKTASVKVGVTVNGIEHIDYLPVMDYRNSSIPIDKVTSMDVNTTIQRSTTKAIAMHGLGISIFKGEDLVDIATPPAPPKPISVVLDLGDVDMKKTLDWIASNKSMGLPKIVKTLEQKYKITAKVKKEIANIIKD